MTTLDTPLAEDADGSWVIIVGATPSMVRSIADTVRGHAAVDRMESAPNVIAALRAGTRPGAARVVVSDAMLGSVRGSVSSAVTDPPSAPLTERERDVLHRLADGRTTKEMARLLGVSTHTVRNHVRNLTAKLGARSRLEAVAIANRTGLLGPPDRIDPQPRAG